jgi:hypothetical protein
MGWAQLLFIDLTLLRRPQDPVNTLVRLVMLFTNREADEDRSLLSSDPDDAVSDTTSVE